jgi:hypothetical protein
MHLKRICFSLHCPIEDLFSWSEKRGLISDIACFPAEISPICTKGEAGKRSPFSLNRKKVLVASYRCLILPSFFFLYMMHTV